MTGLKLSPNIIMNTCRRPLGNICFVLSVLPNNLKLSSEPNLHTPSVPGAEESHTITLSLFRTQAFLHGLFFFNADNIFLIRKKERAGSSF